VAERMNTAIRGATVAMRNANDGVSMLQTVEGGLGRLSENLQRIRELAVQSANGIISNDDRQYLQAEVDQLQQEIARLVENTKFNDVTLFDSSLPETLTFQIGPDSTDTIDVETASYDLTALSTYAEADIGTAEKAADLIDAIDADLDAVNSARASSGAVQSRFETIVMQLQVFAENTAAARSRIMDADYAQETANLARAQILQQAGSAMLSQANAQPQMVLQLLQSVG
jgi:flagellin